ncbi:MAG: winged helix-turn-helix domain-containing protein [Anaerolineae bacterium]
MSAAFRPSIEARDVSESSVDLSEAAFPEAPIRETDLRYVLACVRQGQCCSVVAPSNMGKSLLLKSLSKDEVRLACAAAQRNAPVTVFVDCLEAGDNEHAFYELLLRRTVDELEGCGAPAATVGTVRAIHHEVLRTTTDISVRSLFATSMRELDRWREVRLVVILDEFDDVLSALPPWPFRQLRALRDALGDKLGYITGTSRRLERLRSDADTYEFRELFHLHTLVLRPLSKVDAKRLVAHLAEKQASVTSDAQEALAVRLSGGHPGLLECLYSMVSQGAPESLTSADAAVVELSAQEPIQKECRRLWDELDEEERDGLLVFVGGGEEALDDGQRRALETKGLLATAEDGVPTVFSPVFEAFLRTELRRPRGVESSGVRCNLETGQIWSDDHEITLSLSEPQRRLVRLLYQSGGAICSYDQIAEQVWGVGEGVTPGAIYELVKRVRQKVEPDWREPCYVVTVPGEGYRLKISE